MDDDAEEPKKKSLVGGLIALVVVTALAFGGGWGFGTFFLSGGASDQIADEATEAPAKAKMDGKAEAAGKEQETDKSATDLAEADQDGEPVADGVTVPLEPVVVNLANPDDVWVRLELSVLFGTAPEDNLVQTIHQDIMAYMKTVKLHQISGASGFLHLKSDLREMAGIRSEGVARDIFVRALLFE